MRAALGLALGFVLNFIVLATLAAMQASVAPAALAGVLLFLANLAILVWLDA
jgi:hypothetical protein